MGTVSRGFRGRRRPSVELPPGQLAAFRALPSQPLTVEIHCVTHWSKLHTTWEGVSLDSLLEGVDTSASFALVSSYGGYTTNLPLGRLRRRWS